MYLTYVFKCCPEPLIYGYFNHVKIRMSLQQPKAKSIYRWSQHLNYYVEVVTSLQLHDVAYKK